MHCIQSYTTMRTAARPKERLLTDSPQIGGQIGGQISPEVELDHFFTSLIRKDAAGGLTLLTNPSQDVGGGGGGLSSSGRLSPPIGPSPAYSLPPSPFREVFPSI